MKLDWAARTEKMLEETRATNEHRIQFAALSNLSKKKLVRKWERKQRLESDPNRIEKLKKAQEKRDRRSNGRVQRKGWCVLRVR